MSRPSHPAVAPDRGGFVLGLVVLMLFAVAVAGAAGYQLVTTEFAMATQSRDGQKALVVARAGLSRYLGETVGVVDDSVSFAIGDGIARVTTRKILQRDSLNHLYYIRSEGSVADVRSPVDPARRAVGTYAWHRMSPLPHLATILMTDMDLEVTYSSTLVSGFDAASAADCPGGGTAGVYGVGTGGTTRPIAGGVYEGNPAAEDEGYSGFAAVLDTIRIRWDILTDPNFPVEFEGADEFWGPNWASLPADSFPLLRHDGNLTAGDWSGLNGGRGVLIVTGTFRPSYRFSWDGIILAGRLGTNGQFDDPSVRGMIVAGMAGGQENIDIKSGTFLYHSCNVYAANRALSYLEVVDNTVFEVN